MLRHLKKPLLILSVCLLWGGSASLPGQTATADAPATDTGSPRAVHAATPQPRLPVPVSAGGGILILGALALGLRRIRQRYAGLGKKKRFYRRIAEDMHHWEFWTDRNDACLFTSSACERISGFAPEKFTEDPAFFETIVYVEDREHYRQALQNDQADTQFRLVGRNGEIRWIAYQCRTRRSAGGTLLGRHASIRDITTDKTNTTRLQLAQHAIDSSSHPIGMATLEGTITYVNQALLELFDYTSAEEMTGRPLPFLLADPTAGAEIIETLHRQGTWHGERPAKTAQGELFALEIQAFVTRNATQTPLCLTAYFSDVTSKKAMEREIRQLAFCDALTGLPNRLALKNELDKMLREAALHDRSIAVLMFDLDDFKQINDTIGHTSGDELLKQLTLRLQALLGQGDKLARMGGDEFVLVLANAQRPCEIAAKTEQALAALSETPFDLQECQFFTSASVGIALYPRDGHDAGTLLKHADMAMYAAKRESRNTYRFFSEEIHRRTIERHQMEAGLRRAVRNGEFFLVYQPQVDLATGQMVGIETLVRWQHPDMGELSPGMFIAAAEEIGLIHALGDWILQTACRQAVRWQREGLPPMRLAVNLSARQFRQPGLLERIERILQESGLDPRLLELEITESVFMENLESAIETLVDLKARAIQIAIDDFGTGYSSLNYLKTFPIDRIKIAQEFVRDIPDDQDDAAIVETMMVMANRLGLKTIAEGVETEEQLEFLRQQGCTEMQGYYFARPLRAEQVGDFFETYDIRSRASAVQQSQQQG